MNDFLYGMFDERIKGVKPFETGLGRNEGGWGFNAAYYVEDEYKDDSGQTMTYQRRRSADEMSVCLADYDIDLKSTPFFGWFDDRTICTNAFLAESAVSRDLQSQCWRTRFRRSPCRRGWRRCRSGILALILHMSKVKRISIWLPFARMWIASVS